MNLEEIIQGLQERLEMYGNIKVCVTDSNGDIFEIKDVTATISNKDKPLYVEVVID